MTESSRSLSPSGSPSFCSLRINSGLLYGLRASRCITLSLRGRSWMSLFLLTGQGPFLGLDVLTPLLMLRREWDEYLGLVSLARAGAGARTVTFLPGRDNKKPKNKSDLWLQLRRGCYPQGIKTWTDMDSMSTETRGSHYSKNSIKCQTVVCKCAKADISDL